MQVSEARAAVTRAHYGAMGACRLGAGKSVHVLRYFLHKACPTLHGHGMHGTMASAAQDSQASP